MKTEPFDEVAFLSDDDKEDYINVMMALRLVSGKWKTLIMWQICSGEVRFNELRRLIPRASQKMLSQHLRELERDGLINRVVYPETPPRVEYSLTELGSALEKVYDALGEMGARYRSEYQQEE